MARGGFRPGAGRPKGSKAPSEAPATPKARSRKAAPLDDIKAAARKARVSPLEYMLRVMNDAEADSMRRDRMAIAAAPFVHGRACDVAKPGSKAQAQADAVTAARGTDWNNLLTPGAPVQ